MIKKAKLMVDQYKKIVDLSRCIADLPVLLIIYYRLLFISYSRIKWFQGILGDFLV